MPNFWRAALTRAVARLAGLCVALLFVVIAVGFAFAGLYVWLAGQWGAAPAAFAVAGLALVLAFLVLALVALFDRRRPSSWPTRGPMLAAMGEVGAGLGEDAGALVRGHRRPALLAALAFGFVLGVSPRARRWLWRLLG